MLQGQAQRAELGSFKKIGQFWNSKRRFDGVFEEDSTGGFLEVVNQSTVLQKKYSVIMPRIVELQKLSDATSEGESYGISQVLARC